MMNSMNTMDTMDTIDTMNTIIMIHPKTIGKVQDQKKLNAVCA